VRRYSSGQLKALSEYFNTIAAAWFTAGIITPFFSNAPFLERIIFSISGFAMSYIFLSFSLFFARKVKYD